MLSRKLSIIIPVYNEEKTLAQVVNQVENLPLELEKEIILIDDGSKDSSRKILENYRGRHKVIFMEKNQGKGAAIRRGFKEASGDVILMQDADLEYDPKEYPRIIKPILDGRADVVYGSRFSLPASRNSFFKNYLANKILTFISNIFTGLKLSDMETGYKVFTREAMNKILPRLTATRFGIEPELTAQVARNKLRVCEVGISYHGRTYEEGKKIGWRDGLAAIWHIIKYNLFARK